MKSQHPFLSVRVALGGIVASALMTQLAFGQTAQDPAPSQDETSMEISIEFNGASMTATLYDNPSARDFASMLRSISRSTITRRMRRSPICRAS